MLQLEVLEPKVLEPEVWFFFLSFFFVDCPYVSRYPSRATAQQKPTQAVPGFSGELLEIITLSVRG